MHTIRLKGLLLGMTKPVVMGILNTTPDSFYAGSRIGKDALLGRAAQMFDEGADILDIGGYSTRPGASEVSIEEELDRVVPAIALLRSHWPQAVLSVDTFRSAVARAAVQAGADIVNDIGGGQLDPDMFGTVADLQVPYILMHSKGTPQTMTSLTQYDDIVDDLIRFFAEKMMVLAQAGVSDVIIDPGFGFAKTIEQNYHLLAHLRRFEVLERPLLVGLSRKSMIWKRLGINPEEALNGTTALHVLALERGATLLRVHDVRPAVEAVKLWQWTTQQKAHKTV